MRIAHVTDFYLPRLGGVEMHIHDLAVRQGSAGHHVEVITSAPGPGADRREEEDDRLHVHRLTDAEMFPWARPAALRAGRGRLREGGYDVVHVHAGPLTPLAYAATALAADLPTAVTMHALISYVEPAFRLLNKSMHWGSPPAVWTAVSHVAAQPLPRAPAPTPPFRAPTRT